MGRLDRLVRYLIIEHRRRIRARDASIQKFLRLNGCLEPNPKEHVLVAKIRTDFNKASMIADEKIALSDKTLDLVCHHADHKTC